jgi:dTMP kinase
VSFVAFEGGEGCGKSTQAARLAARLDAVLTREPGGTSLGETLRGLLLGAPDVVDAPTIEAPASTPPIEARAEALLMAAARAQHVAEVIRPALAAGRHVVTDRFSGSSLAYQGVGRGLGIDAVQAVSSFATDGLEPDIVVLLRVSEEEVAARLAQRRPDRIEAAGDAFHRTVVSAFEELAAKDDRWVVVDASGSVDEVEAAVWEAVRKRLGRLDEGQDGGRDG